MYTNKDASHRWLYAEEWIRKPENKDKTPADFNVLWSRMPKDVRKVHCLALNLGETMAIGILRSRARGLGL